MGWLYNSAVHSNKLVCPLIELCRHSYNYVYVALIQLFKQNKQLCHPTIFGMEMDAMHTHIFDLKCFHMRPKLNLYVPVRL